MRKLVFLAPLGLAILLTLTGCESGFDKESVAVVVTAEYENAKTIEFVYGGKLIWQSDQVTSMEYYQTDNITRIDYLDLKSQKRFIVFRGEEIVERF